MRDVVVGNFFWVGERDGGRLKGRVTKKTDETRGGSKIKATCEVHVYINI